MISTTTAFRHPDTRSARAPISLKRGAEPVLSLAARSSASHPDQLLNQQLRLALEGRFDEAFALNTELYQRFPGDHRIAFNRGWYLLSQGKFKEGFDCLNRGRFINVFGSPPLRSPAPIWRGEDLAGKTVLLRGEGGLGDQIANVRFARHLSELGAKVIVSADGNLLPVFMRVPGVSGAVLAGHEEAVFHHYWVPAMSAAGLLCEKMEDIGGQAYLSVDPEADQKWKRIITGEGLRIGLRWAGNPQFEHEQFRRFPEEQMFEAVRSIPGVSLYSLQRDHGTRKLPADIRDIAPGLATWEDTLGAISQLDLVITSCTSVAHAAAALGKPTAVIVPVLPYYLWAQPGNYSAWYDSVRLFRQKAPGDWSGVFDEVAGLLEAGVA